MPTKGPSLLLRQALGTVAFLGLCMACGAPSPSPLTCLRSPTAECTQAYHLIATGFGAESSVGSGGVVEGVDCHALPGFAQAGYPARTECWLVTMAPGDPHAGTKVPVLRVPGSKMAAGMRGVNVP
jgi:hypothetical protein